MMKIAILGWGSLIWQPKELAFDKEQDWQNKGAILPIEFARISKNGRLTLVITSEGTELEALYATSTYKMVEEAVLNLAVREGSRRLSIGSYIKKDDIFNRNDFKFKKNIKNWIEQTDFDAVIWTNLGEKWKIEENGNERLISKEKRLEYLKELRGNTSVLAEEYIRKTPVQITTKYRKLIEKELKWLPIS
ncbi:hypothetical protein F7643_12425 [Tenacibaculum finnmarkense genomovar finnmarkense]|uniref:Uncharacterized protein n=2 Tax=Tenacibaculum finnmarkense TaxID=2781243 RepID=A0AAP1RHP9_9FLAO|nr:hypothetical protein [Tenacibaculum finnmarkense genomovar finnmarkense]MBE7696227.1 hypothetical protein [Tenacibaculum finnmarkense genomovar finnmarkense]